MVRRRVCLQADVHRTGAKLKFRGTASGLFLSSAISYIRTFRRIRIVFFASDFALYLTEENRMNLKSMPVDRLIDLRNRVASALSAKVVEQRRTLETELAKLTRVQGGVRSKAAFGWGARGKVAAKYRNPDNPAETWAGRGLRPRWLAAAIKSGKKIDDFLIASAPSSKANGRKKARKARK